MNCKLKLCKAVCSTLSGRVSSEMEGIVTRGEHVAQHVSAGDVRAAREQASLDMSKLYLMSYYWTILAMTTVGNLPHPTTKVQYVYVIFQLLGTQSSTPCNATPPVSLAFLLPAGVSRKLSLIVSVPGSIRKVLLPD